jgi:hypothetical protein
MYKEKYLKYKTKYLKLKDSYGGLNKEEEDIISKLNTKENLYLHHFMKYIDNHNIVLAAVKNCTHVSYIVRFVVNRRLASSPLRVLNIR